MINREAEKLDEVYRAISQHGLAAKAALLTIVDSADLAVSTMAASYCMHFAPEECRAALERALKDRGILGLVAKYALKRFDDDSWRVEPA